MRKIVVVGMTIVLCLLAYIAFVSPLSLSAVFGNDIEEIMIEETSTTKVIEITEGEEIIRVLDGLQINKWRKKFRWNLKLAPNIYVVANGQIIGLFENEKFAKIEGGDYKGYYSIPKGVSDNIVKFIRDHEGE